MDRRDFMREAIMLVGGTAALGLLPGVAWADAPASIGKGDKAVLSRIAALMIPKTETFGAADVGAADFVDKMIANWASAGTRASLIAVLRRPKMAELAKLGDKVASTSLADIDAAAFGANDRDWRLLKELIMIGYFGSERYQTEIAGFQLLPGRYDPCVINGEASE